MSFSSQNDLSRSAGAIEAERTLRLVASLPAPEGIEDRVKAGVRAADRQARVMSWPVPSEKARWMQVSGMRAAAAAAIVFVVAGGGWGVYSHIRVAPVPTAVAAPQRGEVGAGGAGMSAAAARRTPKTLDGPVVAPKASTKQRTAEGKTNLLPHGHRAGPAAEKSRASQATQR